MTRFSRLLRICGWCGRLQVQPVSEPTPAGHTGTTHGICRDCFHRMNERETP